MEQRFSIEQVRTLDHQAFVQRFDPTASALIARQEIGALKITLEEFEDEPLAACGSPEARMFFQSLRRVWPHGLFYLSIYGDTLKMLVFSLLPSVTVHKLPEQAATVSGYSKNALFQMLGTEIIELEKTCIAAGLSTFEYQRRSRAVLEYFGFLR